ncbi:MAG: hypothetical protein O2930_11880 [Acidobacteria bacterium]|nr:hypothetical protein [Acidobacteriota bacterium]
MGLATTSDNMRVSTHDADSDPFHDPVIFGIGIVFVAVTSSSWR